MVGKFGVVKYDSLTNFRIRLDSDLVLFYKLFVYLWRLCGKMISFTRIMFILKIKLNLLVIFGEMKFNDDFKLIIRSKMKPIII